MKYQAIFQAKRCPAGVLTVGTGEVVEGSHCVVAVGETGLADAASSWIGADRADGVINRP